MAYGVFYVPLQIELNLSEADLGYPADPDLWDKKPSPNSPTA